MENLQLRDLLPAGVTFIDDGTATVVFVSDGNVTSVDTAASGGEDWSVSDPGAFVAGSEATVNNITPFSALGDQNVSSVTGSNNDIYASGSDVFFKFGQIVNPDDDANQEFVVVEFNAQVTNELGNQTGDTLSNTFEVSIDGAAAVGGASNSVDVGVAEPAIALNKAITTAPAAGGDTVVYQFDVTNTATGNPGAAGFEIQVLDDFDALMPPGTLNIASIVANTSAAPGASIIYASAGNVFDITIDRLDPGETVIFVVTATVDPNAPAGLELDNTASLTFTGLPGGGTLGNPTGSNPGGAGSAIGERTGDDGIDSGPGDTLVNNYAVASSASVELDGPTVDKLIPADMTYTIGETVTYDILITVPSGTTQKVVVRDDIPVGLDFVSHTVITDAASSSGVLGQDFGATLPAETLNDAGGSGGDVSFDFGNINNPVDGNTGNNSFIIRISALVVNEIGNQGATVLTNNTSLEFDDPESGTVAIADPTPVQVTVVEPVLGLNKSIISTPLSGLDGGDAITYRIVIANLTTNTSTADAFDAVFTDTLPDAVSITDLTLVSAPAGIAAADFVIGNAGAGTNNAIVSNPFDLVLGQTIILDYTVILSTSVTAGLSLDNDADLIWTSLPGVVAGERDGSDGVLDDGSVNDYELEAGQTVTVAGIDTFAKSIIDTSTTETGDAQHGVNEDVTIGETITYHLVAEIPEITVASLTVTDNLTTVPGTDLLSLVSVSFRADLSDPNLSFNEGANPGIILTDTNGSGGDDEAVFTFTNLVNGIDANPDSRTNQIVIEVVARVENIPQNSDGDILGNAAELDFGAGTLFDQADVDVVEPEVTVVKDFVDPEPITALDAGDTVQFQARIENLSAKGSNSAAFDVHFTDSVEPGLLITSIDSVIVQNGSIAAPGFTITGGGSSIEGGDGIDLFDLPLDEVVIVTYTATVQDTVQPGETLDNDAQVTWTSSDGIDANERGPGNGYTDADLETVNIDTISQLEKSVFSTSVGETNRDQEDIANQDLVIGETVTFHLATTIPEVNVGTLTITDNLPGVLSVQSAQIVAALSDTNMTSDGGPGLNPVITINGTDEVGFSFTNLVNPEDPTPGATTNRLVVEVVALVEDDPANTSGDVLTNSSQLDFTDATAGAVSLAATEDVDIVEPALFIDKTANTSGADIGDTVIYTLTVDHTAASNGPAFDLTISDDLLNGFTGGGAGVDDDLALVVGSVVVTVGGVDVSAGAVTQGNTGGDTEVEVQLTSLGLTDGPVLITFAAELKTTLDVAGDQMLNTATVDFDSLPGVGGRADSANDTHTIGVPLAEILPAVDKQVVATSLDNTGTGFFIPGVSDLTIGETLTYEVVVTLSDGSYTDNPDIQIVDQLPDFLALTGAPTVSFGPDVGNNGFTVTTTDSGFVDGLDDRFVIDFDIATVADASGPVTDNQITITVQALVLDQPGNASGSVLTNTVSAEHLPTGNTDNASASIEIVEPIVVIDKTADDDTPHLGQVVTFSLALEHDPGSSSDAFDLRVTDTLADTGLTLVAGSVAVLNPPGGSGTGVAIVTGNEAGDTGIDVRADSLAIGGKFTITYQATVTDNVAEFGDTLQNTANVDFDNLPGNDPNQRGGNANDTQNVQIVGPDVVVTKDDGAATVTPGGTLTYTLNVENKATATDDATNIVVVDTLPVGVTFSGAPGGVFNPATRTVTFVIASLAPGASQNLSIDVDVDTPAAAGLETLTNSVSVSHDDIDPTPGDNTDTDNTTLDAAPALTIVKDDGITTVTPGESIQYTITIQNTGDQDSSNVVVVDNFPNDVLSAVSVNLGGVVNQTAGTVQWNLGTVAAGQTLVLTLSGAISAQIPAGVTMFTNTATVSDDGAGTSGVPLTANDNDTDALPAFPNYTISKTDDLDLARPGDAITYKIVVSNIGNQNGTGVVVTDEFAAELLTGVTASNGGAVNQSTGTITWNLGNLDADDTITLTVNASLRQIIPIGVEQLVNAVGVNDDNLNGFDPQPANNFASDTTELQLFVFDSLRDDSDEDQDAETVLRRYLQEREYTTPPLPVAPLFSGATEPGTVLEISLFDENGSVIAIQSVTGDTGGNWVASFANVVIVDHPHSMQIDQVGSPNNDSTQAGFNLRTYFSPALHGQVFFSQKPSVEGVLGRTPAVVMSSLHLAMNHPLIIGWNDTYAYEFLTSSTTPSQYAQ